MEDSIFGRLATDEPKLVHCRTSRRSVQHAYRIEPCDPHPGQAAKLCIETGPDVFAACYYTVDESQPEGSRGSAKKTVLEDCLRTSCGSLPARP